MSDTDRINELFTTNEAMTRDHEAMERLRALPGLWIILGEGPMSKTMASLQRIPLGTSPSPQLGRIYADPAEAVLAQP